MSEPIRLKWSEIYASKLNEALIDEDLVKFMSVLKVAAISRLGKGAVICIASEIGITPTTVYSVFSNKGRPAFDTVFKILKMAGLSVCVEARG